MDKPLIVLITDFTYQEGAIMSMKGVMKSVDRTLDITDGTHEIAQYDIYSASYRLFQSMHFWPKGTIFITVVDPGVGTRRRGSVCLTRDGYIVITPDNGTLTHISDRIVEIRELDPALRWPYTTGTQIFHGRDVFGYCGALLASGQKTFEELGEPYSVDDMIKLSIPEHYSENGSIYGVVEITDPNFGNAWTNIPVDILYEQGFTLDSDISVQIKVNDQVIFNQRMPFRSSFGAVSKGECVAYVNELMVLAFAVNQDSFIQKYQIPFGPHVLVEVRK